PGRLFPVCLPFTIAAGRAIDARMPPAGRAHAGRFFPMPDQSFPDGGTYDVAVIGAGVVGGAIARLLSHYTLRCVLVEAGPDVGAGTSKANTAIWHTGFDATPGTLEARLLRRSYPQMAEYMAQAGVAVERLGGLLLAWNEEQRRALPAIQARAAEN